jgi:hypothetical protein
VSRILFRPRASAGALAMLILSACSSPLMPNLSVPTPKGYVDSAARTRIDPALATTRILAVAVLAIPSARITTQIGAEMDQALIQAFATRNPTVMIVRPDDATARLAEAGLANRYRSFLRDYALTAIPDTALIAALGKTLGVDAIIQGAVVELVQRNGFLNIQNGSTLATVRYRIISTSTGTLLWEGMSSSSRVTVTDLEKAPQVRHALALAERPVLKALPQLLVK